MESLIKTIGRTVREKVRKADLTPNDNLVRRTVLRGFAEKGQAPSIEEIEERVKLSSDIITSAVEKLEKNDLIGRDKRGEITYAYPFSSSPTLHYVVLKNGTKVFALCATDALGISFMLKEDITILSYCPHCGREMTIILKDSTIASKRPEGIIEWVSSREEGQTAKVCCPFINFFCSKPCLEDWKNKNPDYRKGEIYTLEEALEHGRWIFEDFLS